MMTQTSNEWESKWQQVIQDPMDFASWESLIKLAEGVKTGLGPSSSDQDKQNLKTVYDHFLSKFPLCFGYWKKYADWEFLLFGQEAAQNVYERGVASIYNSCELWTAYCSFKMEKDPYQVEEIRGIFERGAVAVGNGFLSHPFWDKYIEFEELQMNTLGVLALLERIITIPCHQYSRYFEKYTLVASQLAPSDLVSNEEYEAILSQIPSSSLNKEEDARKHIMAMKTALHQQTQKGVQERWVYEAEIKRPYFHIKPLDEAQRSNWRKYLDFEESQGDVVRIYDLYERCMVPCALYEEFWMRYVMYLQSKGDVERAYNVYLRAHSIFVPKTKTSLRIAFAQFLEEQERHEEAREIYSNFLAEVAPQNMEMISKYAYFEYRIGQKDKADEIVSNAEQTTEDENAKGFFRAQKIKLDFQGTRDVQGTREAYSVACQDYPNSKYLWSQFLLFEMHQVQRTEGPLDVAFLESVWESMYASSLANESKLSCGKFYLDFLLESMASVSSMNRVQVQLALILKTMDVSKPSLKKRNSSMASLSSNGHVAKKI